MSNPPLYELTVYVSVPPEKADYLLEKLCNTVEDYGFGWERAKGDRRSRDGEDGGFHLHMLPTRYPHQTPPARRSRSS